MPTLVDAGPRYLGTYLSENIAETPEGYRICKNAVIGRTGFQTYRIGELEDPDSLLKDRNSNEEIDLWRDPSEVFAPSTIASFEGKTFTISHPQELLDPDSEREHHAGHVQNVHRGSDPLEDGNWPLLADVIVTDADAIRTIDAGARELSCGYSYRLSKEGERYDQRNIVGNHVALVAKGRAGSDARIYDELPKEKSVRKEYKVTNILKHIFGLGLKEYAKDENNDPEKVAEAATQLFKTSGEKAQSQTGDLEKEEEMDRMQVNGKDVDFYWDPMNNKPVPIRGSKGYSKKKAGDSEEEEQANSGKDRKMKDEEKEDREEEREAKDEEEKKESGKDRKVRDHRRRLHDALDKMLDESKEEEEEGKDHEFHKHTHVHHEHAADADVEELKKLLNEYFDEEEKEPYHAGKDAEESESEKREKKDKEEALEDEEEKGKADDEEDLTTLEYAHPIHEGNNHNKSKGAKSRDAEIIQPEPELDPEDRPESQFDSAVFVLNRLKPFVARSGNKTLINAFDTTARAVNKAKHRESDDLAGGYEQFLKATRRSTVTDKQPESVEQKRTRQFDESYANAMKQRTGRK